MRQINSYIKIPFLSISVFLLFFVTDIHSYRTIKIFEDSSYGPLYPIDVITFQESSILTIRLANNCPNSQKVFPLRSLYPDGTLIPANIIFFFSENNFCPLHRINIFALPDDMLLISYFEEQEEQINQVRFMGMITTLDGTIIDPGVGLSGVVNFDINSTISFPSQITTIKAKHGGGLLFTITYDNLNITWRKFEWDHEGKRLYNMSEGVFTPAIPSSGQYEIDSLKTFETLDNGYGLAYSISSTAKNPSTSTPSSISSHSLVYITLLHESETIWTPPTIIYETSLADVKITIESCASSVDTSSAGYTCFIVGQSQSQDFWQMINFLSMGSIQSYYDLPSSEIKIETAKNVAISYTDVLPLNHEGFCMIGNRLDNFNLQGSLYNITEGEVVKGKDWGIPAMSGIKYSLLNNDTVWTAVPGEDNTGEFWYIISSDLYIKDTSEGGYENKQILSTTPPINATISMDIENITIIYKSPIVLSTGFISIYQKQYNNNTDLLRQSFSASSQYVNVTSDTGGEVIILSSTFNHRNSSYFINIYVNFVRDKNFNEPLMGIESGVWIINTTIYPENQKFTDDKDVLLRLDAYGSSLFQNMSSSERNQFFDNLLNSFSQSIPIPLDRLRTSKRFQHDGTRDDLPILIKFHILATRNTEDMNTEQILNNVDTLVKNKLVTKLNDFENATNLLDSDYGAIELAGIWNVYRYEIAGIICAMFILCVLVFLAHNSNPKGNSMSLFKFIVIFIDFIMDVIFLFYHGRDVPRLYTPSIIFLLAPLSVNFFITMFIFLKEYYGNTRFFNFARENSLSTTILLVFGYIDLESLELLSSNIANIYILNAPFERLASLIIKFGSFAILLLEDIPQLVIQIIYLKSVIVYKFVPLLTLITCSIIILTNIIGRSYDCCKKARDSTSTDEEPSQIDSLNSTKSGRSYLIGTKNAEEVFNKWWEIGSGNAGGIEEGKDGGGKDEGGKDGGGKDEKGKNKEEDLGDGTGGSGVGGNISTDYIRPRTSSIVGDTRPVIASTNSGVGDIRPVIASTNSGVGDTQPGPSGDITPTDQDD